jgi:hypothetical protein
VRQEIEFKNGALFPPFSTPFRQTFFPPVSPNILPRQYRTTAHTKGDHLAIIRTDTIVATIADMIMHKLFRDCKATNPIHYLQ